MDYQVEIIDTWNRRVRRLDRVPLLHALRGFVDEKVIVQGLLPTDVVDLGHDYRLKLYVGGRLEFDVAVRVVSPEWGDRKRGILYRFLEFHNVLQIVGEKDIGDLNAVVRRAFGDVEVSEIVKDAISSVPGRAHYLVDHEAYPDGAEREYDKFMSRKAGMSEFPENSTASGEYVSGDRIDYSGAYAKDGDTISGLEVDGEAWPDLRMMMIDTEETSINSHTLKLHPEVSTWTAEKYAKSGYKFRAEAAKAALQDLIDTHGIDYIELNWHRNTAGEFDDRVDAYGRYIGLVYGGGQCFNAAMVELGHSGVYLYLDGAYLPAEMRLKEYFSYRGPSSSSVETTSCVLEAVDFSNGLYEVLTMLSYASGGYVWGIDVDDAVSFRKVERPDKVVWFAPTENAVGIGTDSAGVANEISFVGSPSADGLSKTYSRQSSEDEYGERNGSLKLYCVGSETDADRLVENMLDDVAYPVPVGEIRFYAGNADLDVGDIVEVRGGPIKRITREVEGEWGDLFPGRNVFRIGRKLAKIRNERVEMVYGLTSPLRSVGDPIGYMMQYQADADIFFEFRLDAAGVGLDLGYHLD